MYSNVQDGQPDFTQVRLIVYSNVQDGQPDCTKSFRSTCAVQTATEYDLCRHGVSASQILIKLVIHLAAAFNQGKQSGRHVWQVTTKCCKLYVYRFEYLQTLMV